MPEASPRSVTGSSAPSRQVSQSCGSTTRLSRRADSGSRSAIQRSLVTVKETAGTLPVRRAHSAGPPSSAMSSRVCGAARMSFQRMAGRMTSPAPSRATIPCCCAATPTAPARASRPSPAWHSASHQYAGSHSVPSGCGADPVATTAPSSARQSTTFVDWVELSTPATSMGNSRKVSRKAGRNMRPTQR